MTRFLRTHPYMKIISLFLAFFIWWLIRGERRTTESLTIGVQVENVPENLIMTEEVEPTIHLQLEGPKTRVDRIDDTYIKPYVLDLKGARKGTSTFWVHQEDFEVPYGVVVKRIVPQIIRLHLEEAVEKSVRVEPQFVGDLEPGFQLAGYEVAPPTVKVRGAKREVAALAVLPTEPIELTKRRLSFEGQFSVPTLSRMPDPVERKVAVKVFIREQRITRLIRRIPVKVAGVGGGLKVTPKTVNLRVRGPAGKVADLMDEELEILINADDLDFSKRKSVRIRPNPPERPEVEIKLEPGKVRVTKTSE